MEGNLALAASRSVMGSAVCVAIANAFDILGLPSAGNDSCCVAGEAETKRDEYSALGPIHCRPKV